MKVALVLLPLLGPVSVAALEVVSTTPDPYALHVPFATSTISVTFDAPPSLPDDAAFRVFGSMSGLRTGTVLVAGDTASFSLDGAWMPGEMVHVSLRGDISSGGAFLDGGHYFAFTIAAGAGPATWSEPDIYSAAQVPYFIYGGDLDEDGTPDVVAPNEGTDDVSVWLNQGDGSFGPRADSGVGNTPSCVFGEDFDNDGLVDLATADIASGTVTVKRNLGGGTLAAGTTLPAGVTTRQVVGGDFDGDNDVDLAATSNGTSQVMLWENTPGGWVRTVLPAVFPGAFAIDAADLDGDGDIDLAVTCQAVDSLAILKNTAGAFTVSGWYRTGDGPWDLRGNDMDGDGDYDLVTVTSFNNRLQVLINDGNGGFPTRTGFFPGSFPLGVYVADLDGDGDQDALSANFNGGSITTWLNDGALGFTLNATLNVDRTGSYAWAHDLDGDGDLDISAVDEIGDWLYVWFNDPAVGSPVIAGGDDGPRLTARPNPAPSGGIVTLVVTGVGDRAVVSVHDVAGRLVRRLHEGPLPEGGAVAWDGRGADGARVAAGAYVVSAIGPRGRGAVTVQRLR
jgi:hypothetical protein